MLQTNTNLGIIRNCAFPSDMTLIAALKDDGGDLPEIQLVDSFTGDSPLKAVREKTDECRKIVSELNSITLKAMKAFEDLNRLRSSLSLSQPPTHNSISLFQDENEVSHLFSDFRSSLSSLTSFAAIIEKSSADTSAPLIAVGPSRTTDDTTSNNSSVAFSSVAFQSSIDRGNIIEIFVYFSF
jgi:hypothetical protein